MTAEATGPSVAPASDAAGSVSERETAPEHARRESLRRGVKPMWQRVGWTPRFWLGGKHADPVDEAREFTRLDQVDGVVMVPRALLRALVERRECSARRDFTADEDGPTSWTTHAVCRVAEGHDGLHTNGYFRWADASTASEETP